MKDFRKTEEAIRKLTPEQFSVTQQGDTEMTGTGALLDNKETGIYVDVVQDEPSIAQS